MQYDFPAPAEVRGVEVYWFDDTGRGQCRVPASWRVMAKVGGTWREIENPSHYGAEPDRYNTCTFTPILAEALRLEITSQSGFAGGIHTWRLHDEPRESATAAD